MKKIQYTAPEILVVRISQKDGILLNASAEGKNILGNGGNTSGNDKIEVQVKGQSDYNVWDDDWSK